MRWQVVRECDFCGSRDTAPFLKIATPNWYDGRALELSQCVDCNLVRATPRPERRDLYRDELIGTTKLVPIVQKKLARPNLMASQRRLVEVVTGAARRPVRRLYEFGCGVGTVLMAARTLGIEAEGNDVNLVSIRMLTGLGFRVRHGFTSELDFQGMQFDAVMSVAYLQESYEPFGDLKRSFELLAPGGAIYIKSAYLGCPEHRASGEAWRAFGAGNFHYFYPETLRAMVETAGFNVLDMRLHGMATVLLAGREI